MVINKVLKLAFEYDLNKLNIEEHFKSYKSESIKIVNYKKNTIIAESNSQIHSIKILLKGDVYAKNYSLEGNEVSGGRNVPISIFGLFETVNNYEFYTATLQAINNCTFLEIDKNLYKDALENDIDTLKYSIKYLSKFINVTLTQKNINLMFNSKQNLIIFLYESAKNNKIPHTICATKELIAQSTNQNIRTLYRNLKKLKEERVIMIEKGKIIITDESIKRLEYELSKFMET